MYAEEGITLEEHRLLQELKDSNTSILYSTRGVHSKCYIWKSSEEIKDVLFGSANFTFSGLNSNCRELLTELPASEYSFMKKYVSDVVSKSEDINNENDLILKKQILGGEEVTDFVSTEKIDLYCESSFLSTKGGSEEKTPDSSGINWGFQKGHGSKDKNEAYIPIRVRHIRDYPDLFPLKQNHSTVNGGKRNRQNDPIDVIWDDGTAMECLLEGTQPINGEVYPNKISSFPNKNTLGEYLRKRIGVPLGTKVEAKDLKKYGRTSVTISLIHEGCYRFDFSVKH